LPVAHFQSVALPGVGGRLDTQRIEIFGRRWPAAVVIDENVVHDRQQPGIKAATATPE
jgi:hypothetical protein